MYSHVLANDGQYPFQVFFDAAGYIRKHDLKDRYPTAGLFAQGQDWLDFRKNVQQDMMRPISALYYIQDLNDVVDSVETKIDCCCDTNGNLDDIMVLSKQFALEAIAVMFLGKRLHVLEGNPLGDKLIDANYRFVKAVQGTNFLPPAIAKWIPAYKDLVLASRDIADITDECIREFENNSNDSPALENTVLGKLISKSGFRVASTMAQDALLAGSDTTGHAGTFLLHNIANNPEVQETLYKEIQDVLGEQRLTKESLSQMKYLKACVQESLRFSPLIYALPRRTNVPIVVEGYRIPAGYNIAYNMFYTVRLTDTYFSQPDKFMPERWLRCPGSAKVDPYANLPFGHGPRSCIGQRFARLELQILLCRLVQRYQMSYSGRPVQMIFKGLGEPDQKINLQFKKRAHNIQ